MARLPEIINYPDWVVVVVGAGIFCGSMVFLYRYRPQEDDVFIGRSGLNLFLGYLCPG